LQGDVESLNPGRADNHTLATSPAAYRGSYHAAAIVNVDPMKPKTYTITLDQGATIPVKLVDSDGKAVDGAGVGGLATWSLWAPDQKAEVTIEEYNPDKPRALLFLHPKRGIGKLIEPKKGDLGPWTVTLEPTGTASGRLVTEDGKPIAGAVLEIMYRLPGHNAWTPSTLHEIQTNKKGEFRLTNLVGEVKYSARYSAEQNGMRTQHYVHIEVKSGDKKDLGDVKPAGID
jgi:hypothetical protein